MSQKPKNDPISFLEISTLTADPNNARTHSADQVEQIIRSIQTFGWTMPIAVDDVIRAGNARVAAAAMMYERGLKLYMAPGEQAGGTPIPDGCVPAIDCSGWSEEQRRAYALADNKLALNAGWNEEMLAAELKALQALDFDIPVIGFSADELADLIGSVATDPTPPQAFPQFDEEIETQHKCPKCGYAWSGKAS